MRIAPFGFFGEEQTAEADFLFRHADGREEASKLARRSRRISLSPIQWDSSEGCGVCLRVSALSSSTCSSRLAHCF